MTITQIKCFWEVTVTQNFFDAADHLFMTQSSVSKNIKALEEELGISLLDRTIRPCTLTPAARRLMPHFGEIMLAFERTYNTLEEVKKQQHPSDNNTFRLFGMPAITRFGVSASIHSFTKINPNYSVALEEKDEDEVILSLQMGTCDVAFCTGLRINLNDYNFQKYRTDTLSIAISKQHPLADVETLPLSSLVNQFWILPPQESPHHQICVDLCQRAGFYPNIILSTSRPPTAMEYLHNHGNNCIYMEITSIINHYMTENHRLIPLEKAPPLDFFLVWKRNIHLPRAALDYLEYMAHRANVDFLYNPPKT